MSQAAPPDRHPAGDAPAPPRPGARRGAGERASLRYRGGSDDIDLDRTVAQLAGHPLPDEDDIFVRERVRTRRRVVLLVDVSGSIRGERIRTAAATVGALAAELSRDARALLLSDCVHNAGPDPRPLAARLPRLDLLLDTAGEQDAGLELARLGRGRLRLIGAYTDVAPALGAIFTD